MFKINLKIAFRSLWKNCLYTVINITGLSVAMAVFILTILYVNYETSFDHELPAYERIYLVGRNLPDFKTDYTPAPLVRAIRQNFEEVELAGLTRNIGFEIPVASDHGKVFSRNPLQVQSEVVKMFNINPDRVNAPNASGFRMYLPELLYRQIFPKKDMKPPQMVALGPSNAAQAEQVSGTVERDDAHSNLKFDLLAVADDISFGNEHYDQNNFRTYIQVREGVDIGILETKIDQLYKKEMVKSGVPASDRSIAGSSVIFLDPLKNLHLKPAVGSDAGYKVLMALLALGILIMVIACINFTNLMIAQANKRAREVGVKKVLGASRLQLGLQFLIETFLQCLLALILGVIIAELLLPVFNGLFSTPLSLWNNPALCWEIPVILFFITLFSGIYPSLVLSGFRPVAVLKGNLQTSYKTATIRKVLLVGQFAIAIIFIIGLLVVNGQLDYMRTEDTGFRPKQVLAIKNMVQYSEPSSFDPVREKIMKIPGVNYATVCSDIPDGSKAGTMNFSIAGIQAMSDFLFVDFDYFETLEASVKEGRFFDRDFSTDTSSAAILNETAVAHYGISDPLGKIISGCGVDYKIIGVVKDLKTQGFQSRIAPTVYTIKNPCGGNKTKILINVDEQRMPLVLANLKSNWSEINKYDGDDFRYQFLDEVYGKLFRQQEQLQAVFFVAAMLTLFIAILGLFAFSAFTTQARMKEISLRKVLGASNFQILMLLNAYYIWIVLLANLIAWPTIYIISQLWLATFAFRIDIPIWPFVIAALGMIGLSLTTVTLQALQFLKRNSAQALKYE